MSTITYNSDEHKTLLRVGSLAGIIGSIFFIVANILHARSPNIEVTLEQVRTVAENDFWVTDHLIFWLSAVLILGGLIALQRSFENGPAVVWAHFGLISAVVSTALISVLMSLDGTASKIVHTSWANAPADEVMTAARIAEMMEEIDIALFSMYIVLFFGITMFLFGLAVLKSGQYPTWYAYAGVILAAASFVTGLVQTYTGLSFLVTVLIFASLASFQTLWILYFSVRIYRETKI